MITLPFVSEDAATRKAIWESDFYSEWKESYNGVLEPTNFRGEENFVRAMLEIAGKKSIVIQLILLGPEKKHMTRQKQWIF